MLATAHQRRPPTLRPRRGGAYQVRQPVRTFGLLALVRFCFLTAAPSLELAGLSPTLDGFHMAPSTEEIYPRNGHGRL